MQHCIYLDMPRECKRRWNQVSMTMDLDPFSNQDSDLIKTIVSC